MSVSPEQIQYIAQLSRLELSETETHAFAEQLDSVISYIEMLNEVDVSGIEPFIYPGDAKDVLRQDIVTNSLTTEDALSNAPQSTDQGFLVPKVIE